MLDFFMNLATVAGISLTVYFWMHIVAFLLSWINADPHNPAVSILNQLTVPLWHWVSLRLPRGIKGFAPYLALMLVLFGEQAAPGIIRTVGNIVVHQVPVDAGLLNIVFHLVKGALYVLINVINFIFLLAIVWFVITIANPPLTNPIVQSIMFLIDPLLAPLQRTLPRAKIDLSPLVLALIAYFAMKVLTIFMMMTHSRLIIL